MFQAIRRNQAQHDFFLFWFENFQHQEVGAFTPSLYDLGFVSEGSLLLLPLDTHQGPKSALQTYQEAKSRLMTELNSSYNKISVINH